MTDATEVARDALRMAGLGELAEHLEWAVRSVAHRRAIRDAVATAVMIADDCTARWVHDRSCSTANALHAVDPAWSRAEVDECHAAALEP